MVEEVTTFSDSDWAGCKETRKTSSACVMLLGNHNLKAYTCKQKSLQEAVAAVLGAPEGIVSLLKDLGCEIQPVLAIDGKATEHTLQ